MRGRISGLEWVAIVVTGVSVGYVCAPTVVRRLAGARAPVPIVVETLPPDCWAESGDGR